MKKLAATIIVSLLLASSTAQAQQASSIALNPLEPSEAGDPFATFPGPHAQGNPEVHAKIVFDYAHEPLRLIGDQEQSPVVAGQAFLHLNAAVALADRALLSVLVPAALYQDGDDPSLNGAAVASPSGPDLGDFRFGLRVRIVGDNGAPFQLGTGLWIHAPTGPDSEFIGEGAFRETPYFSIGGDFHAGIRWRYGASLGAMIRPSDAPSAMRYGAGLAALLYRQSWQVGAEFHAASPLQNASYKLQDGRELVPKDSTNAELLVSTRLHVGPIAFSFAGGPGLTKAVGTPTFRLLGGIGYEPRAGHDDPRTDTDGDGVRDDLDGCPYAFGPLNNRPAGCPIVDDDEDGIANEQDACPQQHGYPNVVPARHGCE